MTVPLLGVGGSDGKCGLKSGLNSKPRTHDGDRRCPYELSHLSWISTHMNFALPIIMCYVWGCMHQPCQLLFVWYTTSLTSSHTGWALSVYVCFI